MFQAYLAAGTLIACFAFVPPLLLSAIIRLVGGRTLRGTTLVVAASFLVVCALVALGWPTNWAAAGLYGLGSLIVIAPAAAVAIQRNRKSAAVPKS
ncbi:hypothetical protein K8O93_16380 [Gordonia bronchialis]|uniref:hypothetical protein n=1 Tax=Gordonia bronchialis TaxID=2054 RepID=UPI001CBEB41C|nr:hypothetical protein [Gordonia bronchialis]UAK36798.1 hypothetical protein K8O93_16380 [Gordonia bronchialis]